MAQISSSVYKHNSDQNPHPINYKASKHYLLNMFFEDKKNQQGFLVANAHHNQIKYPLICVKDQTAIQKNDDNTVTVIDIDTSSK